MIMLGFQNTPLTYKRSYIVTINNGCNTPETDDTNPALKEVNPVLYQTLIVK
ncbi:hypothetical protein [Mucilaginibacter sp. CSA2-8R]|uniref:hypothetical protein n=1 Tax=Mucilaginibacter sp. CSA2-8R TaxID=3141542 RepID=UPI00315C7BC5